MEPESNIPPSTFDDVERYLLLQMTPEERTSFEVKMNSDNHLASEVQHMRSLILGVQEAGLRERLSHYHQELPGLKDGRSRLIPMRSIMMAAAVLLLVAVGSWLFIFNKSAEEKLFANYYRPDPGLITAMSTSDNYTFDRAMIDYKTGNYDAALKAWRGLLAANGASDTLHYFIASAYMAQQKTNEALPHFEKVIAAGRSYFMQDAYWYAGLALLKQNKKQQALTYIAKSDRPQKSELLQKLSAP